MKMVNIKVYCINNCYKFIDKIIGALMQEP